ncbi:hypothetical protein Dsin_029108 [Dipteronia sinensis]|uniref:Reverse transcriptase domain-containing protein n=1 Tax=Dipteronia sinensis TaxID=43782 RepID=A0AAD9ZT47_9ROSI|nr:hypothetical protein Dsin_029108 [Dipteronia sinensis]
MCSSQHGSPWIVLGDFNVSRSVGESIGGCSRISGAMKEFNDCLQSLELDDLRFSGFLHTWCNKRSNSCISKKLDRVLVNNDWLVKFENFEAIFLPFSISDHCPSVVKLGLQGIKKNPPFKIFNFLTDGADFLPLVDRCWWEQVHGTMQYKLCSKLRNLKKVLETLNNDKVGDLTIKSIEAKAALDDCQRLLDQQPLDSNLKIQEKELISCYTMTLKAEEDLLRQKSRIQWLKAGDRNSSYFFKAINGKRNRSKIHTITGDDGSLIEGDILVISNRLADFTGRDVTDDEIREVCFSLHPNKAHGPDGFNAHFFKITRDIVGEDVISVVQEFFRSGLLLKELNATILALVPKVPNPSRMKDFRPISCCNTLYKIIAKIIANRIKHCLPDIISPSQSAFVADRCIGDNILLVQELMRNYNKDARCPRLALKVDLIKAFDMVDWGFLLETLVAVHFPPKVIMWIKACLTTPKFSISINGDLAGFFSGKRGLRQGDPMSPYLFAIAMEVLSKILAKRIEDSPSFKFHWRVSGRLATWLNRGLSYAGRLQLIVSVLTSLQVFCASDSKGAKICWLDICLPKKEGGLGIKDLSFWNKALLIRHIWILSYGTNNLWSSWIKAYHLKDSNLWETKTPCTCSWNWRKLLHLRPLVRLLIQHYIGNGSSTSLWFDNWHSDGPLLSKWSPRVVYDSGLPIHTTVSSIVHGDSWSWPAAMSIDLFEIRSHMPSYNPNSNVNDRARWLPSSNGTYSASSALASLRTPHPFVPWFKLRGNSSAIVANKLCLGVAVYHFWRERNCRIFEGTQKTSLVVARSIMDTIRCRLSSFHLKNHPIIDLNWNVNSS